MTDTADNQNEFPQQNCQKPGLGFPIARIVGLVSLSTGALVSYAASPYQGKGSGETSLFATLFGDIASSDLLLADRYYCTWAILARLMKQGSHLLVQNHAQRKPNFREGKRLGAKDHIIGWKKPNKKPVWITDAEYRGLPDEIVIREFSVGGTHMGMDMLRCKSTQMVKKEIAIYFLSYNLIRANIARSAVMTKKTSPNKFHDSGSIIE